MITLCQSNYLGKSLFSLKKHNSFEAQLNSMIFRDIISNSIGIDFISLKYFKFVKSHYEGKRLPKST